MKRFKSARHLQRFVTIHDPITIFTIFPATASPLLSTANCAKPPIPFGAISLACNLRDHYIIHQHASEPRLRLPCHEKM